VAEELVSLGVPVIGSTKAPWGTFYPFLCLWDSPEEYRAMLRGLSTSDWHPPTPEQIEGLYQFVREYRLNISPGQDLPIPVRWLQWKDKDVEILARDISETAEKEIGGLFPDSPVLVEWLQDRLRGYRAGKTVTREPQVMSESRENVLEKGKISSVC
jgi:hypothetical protein